MQVWELTVEDPENSLHPIGLYASRELAQEAINNFLKGSIPIKSYDIIERKVAYRSGISILLDEEYGYRYWKWNPGMEMEEFLSYWKNLPTVKDHFMNPQDTLPGSLEQIHGIEDLRKVRKKCDAQVHLHQDDDSYLIYNDLFWFHKGRK